MIEFAYVLVFGLHLLAMNVASAGPLVSLWLHRRARRGDALADASGRKIAVGSLVALTVGMALGFACLGVLWLVRDERYLHALAQLPRRKFDMAAYELLFSWVLLVAYIGLWRKMRNWTTLHSLLAIASASNLLYHFPAMLSMISTISDQPGLAESLATAKTIAWLREPLIFSRVVHVWLASVAAAGVYTMAVALRLARDERYRESVSKLAACGARIALLPTLLQFPVGVWVIVASSERGQQAVMGGDAIATGLLCGSIVASLALLHGLAVTALGDVSRQRVLGVILLFTVIVIAMTGTLRRVHAATPPVAKPPLSTTATQNECSARHVYRQPSNPTFCQTV